MRRVSQLRKSLAWTRKRSSTPDSPADVPINLEASIANYRPIRAARTRAITAADASWPRTTSTTSVSAIRRLRAKIASLTWINANRQVNVAMAALVCPRPTATGANVHHNTTEKSKPPFFKPQI